MTQLDPILALTGSQRASLFAADMRDPQGVLRVSEELTLEQLSGADFFVNARTLLSALDEAPVRATKELGNFELRFVARMLDELRLDEEDRRTMRYVAKRPTEQDVRELHWEHIVEVEHVGPAEPDVFTPRCLGAVGACPPEDCGGAPGYLRLLAALADPDDPERAELLEWLGGPFDPTRVDVEGIDRLLRLAATGELRPDDLEYFSEE
jgi:hypothetical protein